MASPGKFEEEALAALQRAVTRALERKRRLGQYAVFWEHGQVIFDGPDAPAEHDDPAGRSHIGSAAAVPCGTECPEADTEQNRS